MEQKKDTVFHKHPKATLASVYLVLLSLALLSVELVCQVLLTHVFKTHSYNLVFNLKRPKDCNFSFFDPILSYAHSPCHRDDLKQIPGFSVYPDSPSESSDPTTIVALGGSTTDPILFIDDGRVGPDNWPKLLSDRCQEEQLDCQLFNGGVSGFSSSQELLKLIRDVQTLRPDIVISLNGINDVYFFKNMIGSYPYSSQYQQDFAMKLGANGQVSRFSSRYDGSGYQGGILNRFMPNFREIVNIIVTNRAESRREESGAKEIEDTLSSLGLNFGSTHDAEPWDIWYQNVLMMNSISETLGARYYVFLQPTMGIGEYTFSAQDLAIREQWKDTIDDEAYRRMSELYDHLRPMCRSLDFCTDLSDLFQGQSDLYVDPRHPNSEGNRLQADAIFDSLMASGVFSVD